jgi:hypothetical protein
MQAAAPSETAAPKKKAKAAVAATPSGAGKQGEKASPDKLPAKSPPAAAKQPGSQKSASKPTKAKKH